MKATPSNSSPTWLRQATVVAATLVALAAALPLLIFAGWAARVLLVIAIPLAVVVVVTSPQVRRWLGGELSETASYRGLHFPSHVRLHPSHTWARINPERTVTVGADDLMQQTIGPIEAIEVPEIGDYVRRGEPLFELRHGDRTLHARAPVSGFVVRTNTALSEDPELLNLSPYFGGWVAEIEPDRAVAPLRGLKRGMGAVRDFCGDVDSVLHIASSSPAHGAVYAQDGGMVSSDLYAALDDAAWERARHEIFERN